jgi:hypothetical protein
MPHCTTRSGRKIKKPENFVPTEQNVEDDFGEDEHDSEFDSDIDTSDEEDFSSEDDESDMTKMEISKDFVVEDESESEEESA